MADFPSQRSRKLASGSRVEGSRPSARSSGRRSGRKVPQPVHVPEAKQREPTDSPTVKSKFADDAHYKSSVKLRAVRDELLRVRGKLQNTLYEKYGGRMAKLLKFFDSDHDGEISLPDFLNGVDEYHWPVTRDEALLIFAGIDEDGSGGLDFQELVNVFEPASLASGHAAASNAAGAATEDIEGFVRFTRHQIDNIEGLNAFTPRGTYIPRQKDPHVEAIRRASKMQTTEDDVKRICGGLEPENEQERQKAKLIAPRMPDGSLPPVSVTADGRIDLDDEKTDGPPPFDEELKRCPVSVDEELAFIKRQIAGRLRRRGADFFDAFRRFDENDRGFLTQQQFVGLCGPKGFDLGLSRRAIRVLLRTLSDAGGAVEPLRFDSFLKSAATDETTGDAMRKASLASLHALKARASEWERRGGGKEIKKCREELLPSQDLDASPLPSGRHKGWHDEEGIEFNKTGLLRSTIPSGRPDGTRLHPSAALALSSHHDVARNQVAVTFGKPTDPGLGVPASARDSSGGGVGAGTARSRPVALSPIVSGRSLPRQPSSRVASPAPSEEPSRTQRSEGSRRGSGRSTGSSGRRRRGLPPIPRSLGLATQWSDVAHGAHPGTGSGGVARHRRKMMFARSLPSLPASREGGGGSKGSVASAADSQLEAMFRAAGDRAERTWRTSMRPARATQDSVVVAAGEASAAFLPESERFVHKSKLAPGEWERECATTTDPAILSLANRVRGSARGSTSGRGPASGRAFPSSGRAALRSPAVAVGGHGMPLGEALPSQTVGARAKAVFGTHGGGASRLRGEERAKKAQSQLQGIQRRADRAAELTALRAEARAVAKAKQRLQYAQASLGFGQKDMQEV